MFFMTISSWLLLLVKRAASLIVARFEFPGGGQNQLIFPGCGSFLNDRFTVPLDLWVARPVSAASQLPWQGITPLI
jgi:hypothetical protein